jgi:D-3-phosphoglycerate dehydrogenase
MQVELPQHRDRIEAAGLTIVVPEFEGQAMTEEGLKAELPGAVAVIAGDDPFSAHVLESAQDLKVLVRWGIGMDSVDHAAAAEAGIIVRNTPGVFGAEVADSAFGYMLLLARGHHLVDAGVRAGSWPKVEGITLAEQRLGVVGLGSIGAAVAARGVGFGMDVVGCDPIATCESARSVALDELLSTSRFVVLTAPLTPETHHLIDDAALSLMRRDAFLVNVGRGGLVDERALLRALSAGRLAGAGLDVFEVEPLPDSSPLRTFDSVVLGAHNGSNTREGVARASARAVDIVIEELARMAAP